MLRLLPLLALGVLASTCVLTDSVIAVEPVPVTTQPLAAAKDVKVAVRVEEGRATGDDIVGRQLDNTGHQQAPIRTARHPREILKLAAERELAAKGFTIAPGGAVLELTLREMWADWRTPGGPQSTVSIIMVGPTEQRRGATMRVRFEAAVLDAAATKRGAAMLYGQSKVENSMFNLPGMATKPLAEQALQDALGQLVNRPELIDAIIAANRRG